MHRVLLLLAIGCGPPEPWPERNFIDTTPPDIVEEIPPRHVTGERTDPNEPLELGGVVDCADPDAQIATRYDVELLDTPNPPLVC